MQNPSLQRPSRISPTQGQEKPMQPIEQNSQGYNTFDMSMNAPTTQRFGEVSPSFFFECVPGDRIIHRSNDEFKANKLVAPLLSTVSAYEDLFTVPFSSLYPINWQKITTNPTKGNDVPEEALPNMNILEYIARLLLLPKYAPSIGATAGLNFYINGVNTVIPSAVFSNTDLFVAGSSVPAMTNWIRMNFFLYALKLLSSDSLLARSGYLLDFVYATSESDDGNTYLESYPYGTRINFQTLVDMAFSSFMSGYNSLLNSGSEYKAVFYLPAPASGAQVNSVFGNFTPYEVSLTSFTNFRDWLNSVMSQGGYFSFGGEDSSTLSFQTVFSDLAAFYRIITNVISQALDGANDNPLIGRYNPSRILAYNQVCASYYSNPSVDYIYSSQLYMQNLESTMLSPIRTLTGDNPNQPAYPTFSYNGVSTRYDLLTVGFTDTVFSVSNSYAARLLAFYANFFTFNNSLRYLDFFCSARPNMVAVGDVNYSVDVANGQVSAVDTAQSLVRLRFQQAVNRVSSEIHSYLQGIFGISPVNDMPEPHFCSRQRLSVNREINTNVGTDLGTQNTNISGTGSTSAVDLFIDEECILIGCRTFTVLGSYRKGINPHLFNIDRFDKFNPLLQALGDQAISSVCYTGKFVDSARLFGYTERYGEYKMPISFATGGANNNLPGWFFYYDSTDPDSYVNRILAVDSNIKPSLIRHYPVEFDTFFNNPATINPSEYYHFVISSNSEIIAHRRMSFRSSILWL